MKSVKKKLEDLEKLKKEMSDKLDKYEIKYNNEKNNLDLLDIKNSISENNEKNKNDKSQSYKQIMDQRLNDIMKKIDDNIINQNYGNLYKFLAKGNPYIKSKKNKNEKSIKNQDNSNIKSIDNNQENQKIIPEKDELINEIPEKSVSKSISSKNEEVKEPENLNKRKNNNVKSINKEKQIAQKNQQNQPKIKSRDVFISYNGGGKIDLEDLKSQQDIELLHQQQKIFLGNELSILKIKLNELRKQNEDLKRLSNEKGMVKNITVLEKFIGKFVERLSLNWDEIVNMIIDELLIEEAYELNKIDLKKMKYDRNKLVKNMIKAGFGGILSEKDEKSSYYGSVSSNMELIENLEQIQAGNMINKKQQHEEFIKELYRRAIENIKISEWERIKINKNNFEDKDEVIDILLYVVGKMSQDSTFYKLNIQKLKGHTPIYTKEAE